jgi:hypothetical protein
MFLYVKAGGTHSYHCAYSDTNLECLNINVRVLSGLEYENIVTWNNTVLMCLHCL